MASRRSQTPPEAASSSASTIAVSSASSSFSSSTASSSASFPHLPSSSPSTTTTTTTTTTSPADAASLSRGGKRGREGGTVQALLRSVTPPPARVTSISSTAAHSPSRVISPPRHGHVPTHDFYSISDPILYKTKSFGGGGAAEAFSVSVESSSLSLSVPLSTGPSRSIAKVPSNNDDETGANASLNAMLNDDDDDITSLVYYPPDNFSLVCAGVYRSAFPKKKNFSFLKKLGIRTILTLILEDYPEQNIVFLNENDIQFLQFGVPGNKEPFVDIPEDRIRDALSAILDRRNHPILIHCNKGKHRTGCLIGCLRKFLGWSHTSIFDEYRTFSHPKARSMDQQFIELFDPHRVAFDAAFLPDWPETRGLFVESTTTTSSSSLGKRNHSLK